MKVGVIGGGYIGSAVAKAVGMEGRHEVWLYDLDPSRVAHYVPDATTGGVLEDHSWLGNLAAGQRFVRASLPSCDIFLICVNTPRGGPEPVCDAVRFLMEQNPKEGSLVCIESSVPVGFTREQATRWPLFLWAHSPERLWPGHEAEWPLRYIPKLVGGVTEEATKKAADFYRTFMERDVLDWGEPPVETVVECSSPEVTEIAKLYENTQRALGGIYHANICKELCQRHGVDFEEVRRACATKPFGYMNFYAGKIAGDCLPSNVVYWIRMLEEKGIDASPYKEALRRAG